MNFVSHKTWWDLASKLPTIYAILKEELSSRFFLCKLNVYKDVLCFGHLTIDCNFPVLLNVQSWSGTTSHSWAVSLLSFEHFMTSSLCSIDGSVNHGKMLILRMKKSLHGKFEWKSVWSGIHAFIIFIKTILLFSSQHFLKKYSKIFLVFWQPSSWESLSYCKILAR